MSAEIDRLREAAPAQLPDVQKPWTIQLNELLWRNDQGAIGSSSRTGFIRVEVLVNDTVHDAQVNLLPILSLDFEVPLGRRPPDLIAQQGGWMATQTQIARMNNGLCMGFFLPPFDPPSYYGDGQESMNVEFWSGSYQFFTGVKSGCNMQRLMSIHPDHFSKHLIYHVANNKQKQLARERMVRADNLFAQLNSVQKMAQAEKEMKRMEKKSKLIYFNTVYA